MQFQISDCDDYAAEPQGPAPALCCGLATFGFRLLQFIVTLRPDFKSTPKNSVVNARIRMLPLPSVIPRKMVDGSIREFIRSGMLLSARKKVAGPVGRLSLPLLFTILVAFSPIRGQQASPVNGTIRNLTNEPVQIYWVDTNNQNQGYLPDSVPPDGEASFQTYPGTRWRAYANQRFIQEYQATAEPAQTFQIRESSSLTSSPTPPSTQTPLIATVRNDTNQAIELHWVDTEGSSHPYISEPVQPGASAFFQTYPGGKWRAYQGGQPFLDYSATSQQGQVFQIRVTPQPAASPSPDGQRVTVTVKNGLSEPLWLSVTNPGEAEKWHSQVVPPGEAHQLTVLAGSQWRVWNPNKKQVGAFTPTTTGQVFTLSERSEPAPPVPETTPPVSAMPPGPPTSGPMAPNPPVPPTPES